MITDFNDMRQRILRGEELTIEEYKAYIAARMENRQLAAASAAAKPKRTSKTISAEESQKLLDAF